MRELLSCPLCSGNLLDECIGTIDGILVLQIHHCCFDSQPPATSSTISLLSTISALPTPLILACPRHCNYTNSSNFITFILQKMYRKICKMADNEKVVEVMEMARKKRHLR
jgi:hypothetical protein